MTIMSTFFIVFNLIAILHQPNHSAAVMHRNLLGHLDWRNNISDGNQDPKLWIKYIKKLISVLFISYKQEGLIGRLTKFDINNDKVNKQVNQ